MNLLVFAVYDKKGLSYGDLFCFQHRGQAMRVIEDEVAKSNSALAKHPADYQLWCLGSFNLQSGELIAQRPDLVVECIEFAAKTGV